MATVSSAKLSKTRARAAGLRLYAQGMRTALARQDAWLRASGIDPATVSPFLRDPGEVRSLLLLHISSDRGLCGNHALMANRRTVRFIRDAEEHGVAVRAVVKGLKGEAPVRRRTDADLVHVEGWSRAGVTEEDVTRLGDLLVEPFLAGEVQEVWTTYTEFHSPLLRTTRTQRLLPIGLGRIEGVPPGAVDGDAAWWSHEPEAREVLHALVEAFVLVQVEEVLLQSYASEQGARMITMEEATERADKTLQECHVQFNRLRRESITTDLLGSLFATSLRQAEETPVAAGRGV